MKHEVTDGECIYCKQDVDFPHVDNECSAREESESFGAGYKEWGYSEIC